MSVTSFIPEVWSAAIIEALRKAFVYQCLVNRDYEGEVANAGDTVHITSISDPTINNYASGNTLTYESLSTADRALVIDQGKSFSFVVDDVDARQMAGTIMGEAMTRAAYKLADLVDQLIAGTYAGIQAKNQVGTTSITTADLAYTNLVKLNQKLTEANVATTGRCVVIPPWYNSLLLQDVRFTSAFASQQPAAQTVGFVGEVVGMKVFQSNNTPVPGGVRNIVLAGVPTAITYADQINQVEALRLQTTFGDAVRGLHVYGCKLIRPDSLVSLDANTV